MFRAGLLALLAAFLILSGGIVGQDNKSKDEKKAEPPVRAKGILPPHWRKLGLSDAQVQDIYKVQNKYDAEIDKLEAEIDKLKSDRMKDMKAVLSAEQKKRLDAILIGKDK